MQMRTTSSRSIPISLASSSGVRWLAIVPPQGLENRQRKSPPSRYALVGLQVERLWKRLKRAASRELPSRSEHTPGRAGCATLRFPARRGATLCPLGVWRSLVARSVRVGEAPSSNLGTPTSPQSVGSASADPTLAISLKRGSGAAADSLFA